MSAPLAGADETAPSALADLEKSLVLIETEWTGFIYVPASASADDQPYWTDELTYSTTCTAFFVSETAQLATAGHCVDPADGRRAILEGYITDQEAPDFLDEAIANWLVEGDEAGKPVQRTVFGFQPENVDGAILNSRATTLEVIDFEPYDSGDVALLRVPDLSKPTPAMPIAQKAPDVGAELTSIGFPGILRDISDQTQIARASFKSGSASSRQVSAQGVVQIEVNTDLQGGMSGGPTVNEDGAVVGVNSSGFNAAGNFNFVTNTPDLRSFLSSNSVEIIDAKAAPAENGGSKTGLILGIVGALILLVVIAGGLLFFLKRKPKPAGGYPPGYFGSPPPNAPPPGYGAPGYPPPGPQSPSSPSWGPPGGPPGGFGAPATGPIPSAGGFCLRCGAPHHENEKFCPRCGSTLG